MRILLATDGSKHAGTALRWLRRLPLPGGAEVFILSVAQLQRPPEGLQSLNDLRDSILADASSIGEQARTALAERWPDARVHAVEGDPREEIVRMADEGQFDLAVLGARGLGRFQRLLVGSVSLTVARYAIPPVLVARGSPRDVRRLLVALDGSPDAWRALQFVASFPSSRNVYGSACACPRYSDSNRRRGSRRRGTRSCGAPCTGREAAGRRTAQLNGFLEVERSLLAGDPREEILRTAARMEIGSRGGRVPRTRSAQTIAARQSVGGRAAPCALPHARCPGTSTLGCDPLAPAVTPTTMSAAGHGGRR